LKEEYKNAICEAFQEIEPDLAFEVLDNWRERRNEQFLIALENLQLLMEVKERICS
jgi:hypothetical protein